MMAIDSRFGLIPLPLSDSNKATLNELMVDFNTGHIYLKGKDKNLSKTFELEQRLTEMEDRLRSYQTHYTLSGTLLYNSIIVPEGVTKTLLNGSVRITGANSLTNIAIQFNKKYCSFYYSPLESYFISMDVDGVVKEATMLTNGTPAKLQSDLARNHNVKVNQKISSIVYNSDNPSITEVEPVIYVDLSGGAVTLRSVVVNRLDTNLYNSIGLGDSLHIDYRYADSYLLEKLGVVAGKGFNSTKSDCFKIYKQGTTHVGYLKIFLPNNIIKPGRYALQIVLKNTGATSMNVMLNPQLGNKNFRVNPSQYTPDVDGRVIVNLSFSWDFYKDGTSEMPYILINSGNDQTILVESVHIMRSYSSSFSDNTLWAI